MFYDAKILDIVEGDTLNYGKMVVVKVERDPASDGTFLTTRDANFREVRKYYRHDENRWFVGQGR